MIELDSPSNGNDSNRPVQNWAGSVFAFADDSLCSSEIQPLFLGQRNAMRVMNALKRELNVTPVTRYDERYMDLQRKEESGLPMSVGERRDLADFRESLGK